MLIPPFLFLEPVQVVHHLSEGRSMFGLVRWLSTSGCPLAELDVSGNAGLGEEHKRGLRTAWGDRDAGQLRL